MKRFLLKAARPCGHPVDTKIRIMFYMILKYYNAAKNPTKIFISDYTIFSINYSE